MVAIQYERGELVGEAYYLHEANRTIKRRMACFRCKCGNKFFASIAKVKSCEVKGCGCMKGHALGSRGNRVTHGLTGRHSLYNVWCAMRQRCYNKNRSQYADYGGNGVTVCDEWRKDFKSFYNWAINNGWQKGLQLDKDTKGDGTEYSPSKCCFVTPKVNSNKRKTSRIIEYNGVKKTSSQWADELGISLPTFNNRLYRGNSIERIMNFRVS